MGFKFFFASKKIVKSVKRFMGKICVNIYCVIIMK